MRYDVVEREPMLVMGIEVRTTNENNQAGADIGRLWGRFYREQLQLKIPHCKTGQAIGLYCEYEKDHTKPYTFVSGCEVALADEIPDGMVLKKVPAAKYAVFSISGPFPDAMYDAWIWVWEGNLHRTYSGDFELYPLDFHPETNPRIELYVAIH